jgi:O-6-methylguanine DNA methyltransferase
VRAKWTQYSVPGWGVGELWTGDGLLLAHEFRFGADAGVGVNRPRAGPPKGAHGPPTGTVPGRSARLGHGFVPESHQLDAPTGVDPDELIARFGAFLAGEDVAFDDVALDLGEATSFQRAIVAALRALPRGEVVSYGELAALAGRARAARAVGTFCARNRFMLVLPCHRVVGSDGIGGYGSAGIAVKRRLLALEGIRV